MRASHKKLASSTGGHYPTPQRGGRPHTLAWCGHADRLRHLEQKKARRAQNDTPKANADSSCRRQLRVSLTDKDRYGLEAEQQVAASSPPSVCYGSKANPNSGVSMSSIR
jgi:hypothetical protein